MDGKGEDVDGKGDDVDSTRDDVDLKGDDVDSRKGSGSLYQESLVPLHPQY